MHVETKLPAALWLALFLMAGGAAAAPPDLRLVDAMADRDAARVRALLDEGLDPDTARADGATALLWAAHWDDTGTTVRPSSCSSAPAPTPTPPTITA